MNQILVTQRSWKNLGLSRGATLSIVFRTSIPDKSENVMQQTLRVWWIPWKSSPMALKWTDLWMVEFLRNRLKLPSSYGDWTTLALASQISPHVTVTYYPIARRERYSNLKASKTAQNFFEVVARYVYRSTYLKSTMQSCIPLRPAGWLQL